MDENPVCDSSFWSPYSGNGSQCQCEQFVFGRVELSVGRLNGGRRCEIRQNVTMAWTEQLCEVFAINRPIRTNHKFLYANIAPMADTALIFGFRVEARRCCCCCCCGPENITDANNNQTDIKVYCTRRRRTACKMKRGYFKGQKCSTHHWCCPFDADDVDDDEQTIPTQRTVRIE